MRWASEGLIWTNTSILSYLVDTGDGADLVDLVKEDDSSLRTVHVVVGVLRGGNEVRA